MKQEIPSHPGKLKAWIEAVRLRTLPVSIAGVIAGTACAILLHGFRLTPALICLAFALLAQITSNFANEYFDFKYGLDKKGREGFRRGVTEGDITPGAMRCGVTAALLLTMATGCTLLFFGPAYILIPAGILIGIFALAYSTGPYPISHHGLGDVAVVIFFGIVPVTLTCALQTGKLSDIVFSLPISVSVGLMASEVLMVNNYRDIADDLAVGKRTTAVIFGPQGITAIYLASGILAVAIAIATLYAHTSGLILLPAGIYLCLHILIWKALRSRKGSMLNPMLGMTACNLMLFTAILAGVCITCAY